MDTRKPPATFGQLGAGQGPAWPDVHWAKTSDIDGGHRPLVAEPVADFRAVGEPTRNAVYVQSRDREVLGKDHGLQHVPEPQRRSDQGLNREVQAAAGLELY